MRLEASGGNNRSELPLPLAGRGTAYGIFNESSLRTQGPIRRGLSFLHWSRGLLSLLRPGVMGPCVRRDDPPRDCAMPRHRLKLVICDSPALAGEGRGGGASVDNPSQHAGQHTVRRLVIVEEGSDVDDYLLTHQIGRASCRE